MSPRLQVPPLQEITLLTVARQLIHALSQLTSEEDPTLSFAEVSLYYRSMGATNNIFQDLMNLILNSKYLPPSVRFYTMRLLLQENVKTLTTGKFPYPYYKKVLELISEQGQHLTSLNMKGVLVKEEYLPIMCKIIENLKNLTALNIPYIANDDVLECIGEHNNVLKILDISGETDITEIGIVAMLTGNEPLTHSLTVVNIGMYGDENIDHTDVALLIRGLPNLTNLGNYSYVGQAISYIYSTTPDFKTKLNYIHDIRTNVKTMKAIIAVCPMIETIYLREADKGVLLEMRELKHMNKIKLNNFQCDELYQLLDIVGNKITGLVLLESSSSETFNFTRIAESCKNLESIEFCHILTATHKEEIPFKKLEHIKIIQADMSSSLLWYLMTGSPKLKKLIIDDEVTLDDNDMKRMVQSYEFNNLETLWFPNAPYLTSATVEMLMDSCPKLHSLGELSGWSFTPDDMMLMRAMTASNNLNLILSPPGIFQQGR